MRLKFYQKFFKLYARANANSRLFFDMLPKIGYLRGSLALSLFKVEKHVQEVVLEMNFNLKDFKTFFRNRKNVKKVLLIDKQYFTLSGLNHLLADYCFSHMSHVT